MSETISEIAPRTQSARQVQGTPRHEQSQSIGAIFCLQEFGEHPHCGDQLDHQSGLSYNPEDFYEHGVQFFHFPFCSKPNLSPSMILKMLKSVEYCIEQGFKIAVHSHAGLDRCALLVCTWLIYREKTAMSSHDAMALFRAKRFNSKLRKGSSICKRIERFEVCNLYLEFRPETDEESLLQKGCNRPANSLQCGGAGLSFG